MKWVIRINFWHQIIFFRKLRKPRFYPQNVRQATVLGLKRKGWHFAPRTSGTTFDFLSHNFYFYFSTFPQTERFLNEDGQCTIPNHFMPFSIGGRECIGKKLAMMQLFLFVAGLLQNFTIRAPSNGELPELEPTLSLPIRTVSDYQVMLERRDSSLFWLLS